MYIDDEYLEHLSVKNSTYLNTDTTSKKTNSFKAKIQGKHFGNITLIQQVYLLLLTILALKVLSSSMYLK